MEIRVSKEDLVNGIQTVQNAVSQKSSLPILSNVLLESEKGTLKLTATDLDIGICSTIPVEVLQEGAITVPARKFFDIVKALPEGNDVELSMKKNNFVTIKSGKANFKIIGLPKEEFPQLPLFEDKESVTVAQGVLKNILNLTDFAISRDDTRYVLNGILMAVKGDKLSVVATDGRRLAIASSTLPEKILTDRKAIIPTKAVQEVKRMLQDEGEVQVKFSENQVLFSFSDSFILSRLIEGEYPNYNKVIPERSSKEIKVSRDEFLSATRRANIFTDQDSMAIKLSVKKTRMMISKNTPYLGEAKEEIPVVYTGNDELEIGFNPRYLIDVLKSLDDEEVTFEVKDPGKPGVFRRGEDYIYVVLPMQLAG
ncbi:MAG: DNA polymerase III subunit beta [Candidatus Omnitrophica bacterium]|nr:DNA polymerase III subunit beta [Candidatus Omnitrophota bacterium]